MKLAHNTDIDVNYDFRTDARGKDPDQHSATLRKYHKLLWSKKLPSGVYFGLDDTTPGVYLHHKSRLGEFYLSSDSVIPTFLGWKRLAPICELLPENLREEFQYISYTIGGMMLFPSNRVDGKFTINGERGINRKIVDRLDLTLECIRLHYISVDNPMAAALNRYKAFFDLFDDFRGYVDFFLLNDLVIDDYSGVKFYLPFAGFSPNPVPEDLAQYVQFREATIKFVQARNRRIESNVMGGRSI